jgi:ATP-binding cassette subfamily B protein
MAAVGMALSYYQRSISSSKRLKEIFSQTTDVPSPSLPFGPLASSNTQIKGQVEFRNLTFAFPGTTETVLRGITLRVEAGERIAIVGSIGAGKSALLSLLPRLYPIQRGMLWIDDVDINDWPLELLRRHVGYVSQDLFLFNESILENVAFGLHEWVESGGPCAKPHEKPHDRIEEAARIACVHEEISELENAYKTDLGERGINLSGGQKQRLTIARALAKQPSILVLDDALSSVDVQTEDKIMHALKSRPGRNTEFIAAHRLSTVRDADRILVIKNGSIIEEGNHSKLIKNIYGEYSKFYEQQQIREKLEEDLEEDLENYENELS